MIPTVKEIASKFFHDTHDRHFPTQIDVEEWLTHILTEWRQQIEEEQRGKCGVLAWKLAKRGLTKKELMAAMINAGKEES